jgi:hypothetical protein
MKHKHTKSLQRYLKMLKDNEFGHKTWTHQEVIDMVLGIYHCTPILEDSITFRPKGDVE